MTAQTDSLVRITNVVKHFDISGGFLDRINFSGGLPTLTRTTVKALNSVSLDIRQGEILSVVGESGCGKSTLGRTVLGLYPPTSGEIAFRGTRIDHLSPKEMLPYRRKMQRSFKPRGDTGFWEFARPDYNEQHELPDRFLGLF